MKKVLFILFIVISINTNAQVQLVSGGSANAYTLAFPGVLSYTNGVSITFKANFANTGAATININSLGAKTIKKQVSADVATGDILSGQIVNIVYDGTNFQMISCNGCSAGGGLPNGTISGEIMYWNGSAWVNLAPGTNGQSLVFCNGIPTWGACLLLPTITTVAITAITETTAQSGGTLTADGGSAITAKGVCWSTSPNPTIISSITNNGSGLSSYISNITSLIANTTYYVRAFATNSSGTAYGNELSFTTNAANSLPVITTTAITNITGNSAQSGGNVTSAGLSAVTARGICWSTVTAPTIALSTKSNNGSGIGTFVSFASGLLNGTTYYVRAYATNTAGTAYGTQFSFTTDTLPTVTTNSVSSVTTNTAICGGNVTANGGDAVTARGVCWSTSQNPTTGGSQTSDGAGNGTFTSNITGLVNDATYYVRAYAANSLGTAYGNQQTFTMQSLTTVTTTAPTINTTNVKAFSILNISVNIVNGGGAAGITYHGVCWSTSPNPTRGSYTNGFYNNYNESNSGAGTFIINASNLVHGTLYYIRGYAYNGTSYIYGNIITITTSAIVPTVNTLAATNITSTSLIANGTYNNTSGFTVGTANFEISSNASISPVIHSFNVNSQAPTYSGSPNSYFQLYGNTNYYLRARVAFYDGTGWGYTYGNVVSFTTSNSSNLPSLDNFLSGMLESPCLNNPIEFGGFSAETNHNGSVITAKGICYSTTPLPTIANNLAVDTNLSYSYAFSIDYIQGITSNATYYVRGFATNANGTAYSNQLVYLTATPPVFTLNISNVSNTDFDLDIIYSSTGSYSNNQGYSDIELRTDTLVELGCSSYLTSSILSNFGYQNFLFGDLCYQNFDSGTTLYLRIKLGIEECGNINNYYYSDWLSVVLP